MHIYYIWKPECVHFQQLWAITLQGKERPNGFLHATALCFWASRAWNARAPKFHSQPMGQLDVCGTPEHQQHTATCLSKAARTSMSHYLKLSFCLLNRCVTGHFFLLLLRNQVSHSLWGLPHSKYSGSKTLVRKGAMHVGRIYQDEMQLERPGPCWIHDTYCAWDDCEHWDPHNISNPEPLSSPMLVTEDNLWGKKNEITSHLADRQLKKCQQRAFQLPHKLF